MPAPRACRSCGTALPADVRWCGLCHEPVHEFHPRGPVHAGDFVGGLRIRPRTTRWRGGATSLGPVGKVLATIVVVLLGPWGPISISTFLFGVVWVLLAVVALKEIWRSSTIDPDAPPTRAEAFRDAHPILTTRLNGGALAVAGVCLLVISMVALGTGGRFLVLMLGGTVALGFLIAWLSGY